MTLQLFEILKREHRQVEKWVSQMENLKSGNRDDLFVTLQDALEKHMHMEEKHLYPQVKKISEMKQLAIDAIEEHEQVKNFLSQLEELASGDEEWLSIFREMSKGLQHHIKDEESKIFPKCNQLMSEQLLQGIGQKFIEEKEGSRLVKGSTRTRNSK